MKKILLFVFAIMIFLPSVYAGTAYVDNIDIDVVINVDGSMQVTETINWDIEEDLNGLYRDIIISSDNELNSASGIVINSVEVNGKNFNYAYNTLNNGDDLKYNINDIAGGKQVKIFTPSEDEEKTTKITYTLYDVVVEYNDIAELYWNFIGTTWENGIDNVDIAITLPKESSVLRVFGHGPLNGVSNITDEKSVTLNVSRLRMGEQVDARVLFDTALVDTTKVVNENMFETILAKEADLAVKANLRRENMKKLFVASVIISLVVIALPVVVYFIERKKVAKPSYNGKYYRELVEDYGPAVMTKVMSPLSELYDNYNMLATLLDLVRKKYVVIEPLTKKNNKKPYDYKLKLVNENLDGLNEIEQYYIRELIFADVNEITFKELSKKNSKNVKAQENAVKKFKGWKKIITKVATEKDLLKKQKQTNIKMSLVSIICILVSAIMFAVGIVVNYEEAIILPAIAVFVGIFEAIILNISIAQVKFRTEKGKEHNAMWKAFKKYLLDFSKLDEHDYKSLVIWEHYLVYAAALGIAKQVIKELKIVFPNEFNDMDNMYINYATIGVLSDNNFNSFSNSFNTMASSTSGTGGGFSGGAGGRWRRWRRRWFLTSSLKRNNRKFLISKKLIRSFFIAVVNFSKK